MSNQVLNQVDKHTIGVMNYMSDAAEPSLYRNGKAYVRRNLDGGTDEPVGLNLVEMTPPVMDARQYTGENRHVMDHSGFELVSAPISSLDMNFYDHDQVVRKYYPDCAALLAQATGGRVYVFDHNIRSSADNREERSIGGSQKVQSSAGMVHNDYTLTSGPQRLEDLTKPPKANDTLRTLLGENRSLISQHDADLVSNQNARFSIINVWRNIASEPVLKHPLALCDARSVATEDLVVFEIHYQDRIGENYFAKYSPDHRWYYYPEITGEEAILLKQWDSWGELAKTNGTHGDGEKEGALSTFSLHTGFIDKASAEDAPERWSIEVRCIVIYE